MFACHNACHTLADTGCCCWGWVAGGVAVVVGGAVGGAVGAGVGVGSSQNGTTMLHWCDLVMRQRPLLVVDRAPVSVLLELTAGVRIAKSLPESLSGMNQLGHNLPPPLRGKHR
jgi:hypothetical protein